MTRHRPPFVVPIPDFVTEDATLGHGTGYGHRGGRRHTPIGPWGQFAPSTRT